MSKILDHQTRQTLIERHNVEQDKHVADRVKSIFLYDEGWTPTRTDNFQQLIHVK